MTNDSVDRYLRRRRRDAEYVKTAAVPGHVVVAALDYGKAFRSRPGSADWKARCSCGWESSGWQYGEMEAYASAARHVRGAHREHQTTTTSEEHDHVQ